MQNNIASIIDHTNLHPDATEKQIEKLCQEATEWNTASICVAPFYVKKCSELLLGTEVDVGTVVGFPLGFHHNYVKVSEAEQAIEDGASELDMVINIGALKDGRDEVVLEDISKIVQIAEGQILKVIIETALLTNKEIVKACQLALEAQADFVKTSTGFANEGATLENVKLMRKTVGSSLGVKAAGGIRTYKQAIEMYKAGANRIGTSSTSKIIAGS
ncbi:MAG: deoxyribose-phosphate aldolase [Candidatus Marinimicrobia bacterium]|nr:deoxyribose-phosphate aldolase [Candidatus Neomarinimicrobiota bacterium]